MKKLGIFLLFFLQQVAFCDNGLEISPTRILLKNSNDYGALTLENKGNTATTVQTEIVSWQRVNGKDIYQPSTDLIANPPIFKLAPETSQIVRLGLRYPQPMPQERIYRVYLMQVPAETVSLTKNTLQIYFRLGIPIYVSPAQTQLNVQWQATPQNDGHHLQLVAVNKSNVHVLIEEILLSDPKTNETVAQEENAANLFPTEQKRWSITIPGKINVAPSTVLTLTAITDQGKIVAPILMN